MTRLIVLEPDDEFDSINLNVLLFLSFSSMFQDVFAHRTPVKTVSQNNWALNTFNHWSKCMFLFRYYVYFLFTLALSF